MRHVIAALSLGLGLWLAPAEAGELTEAGKKELVKLTGVWRLVSSEREGKIEENVPPLTIEIRGDRFLLNDKDVGLRITTLEPGVTPGLLDITHDETKRTIEAIYELKDDQWRITANASTDGAPERPTEFSTQGNAKFVSALFKRDK